MRTLIIVLIFIAYTVLYYLVSKYIINKQTSEKSKSLVTSLLGILYFGKFVGISYYGLQNFNSSFFIVLGFLFGLGFIYFIAKLITGSFSKKAQPFFKILLWLLIAWLFYISYQSVMKPIRFNAEKTKRYTKVIKSLKVIRDAQADHKEVTGKYAKTGDALIKFIDTAKFAVTESHNEIRKEKVEEVISPKM